MRPIIQVENLSKQYRIGVHQAPYQTIRETLGNALRSPLSWLRRNGRSSEEETIWALKDVSFEVMPGEVVGIIGRNGAGKSTLLKILSRITEPTTGQVDIYGRVGSLLEVGTGFHPELTGRENIYLNGAILGMGRKEIDRKFIDIVDFAEINKFIDTPVKHYSSGMFMRLAFSVAAFLEPEILIVDEVLAVGDAVFQKKCLGKMKEVGQNGRTVLFVSHNLQAIQSLCAQVILLDHGHVVTFNETSQVISKYLSIMAKGKNDVSWNPERSLGDSTFKLTRINAYNTNNVKSDVFLSKETLYIDMHFELSKLDSALCVGFDLLNSDGVVVARSYQTDMHEQHWPKLKIGSNILTCKIPAGLLNTGIYYLSPKIGIHNKYWIVNGDAEVKLEIVLDHGLSPFWNSLNAGMRPGVIAPIFEWYNNS